MSSVPIGLNGKGLNSYQDPETVEQSCQFRAMALRRRRQAGQGKLVGEAQKV